MEKALVNRAFLLKKFEGKGGWTFTEIPEIAPDKKMPFGWVRVQGSIDGYPIRQYKLMPMGNGQLFLPVKSDIRKKIKKEAGDWVHVELYLDDSPVVVPDEILVCLHDAPKAFAFFQTLSDSNQKYYIDWIMSSKKLETKAERIARAIERLEKGLKMHDAALEE